MAARPQRDLLFQAPAEFIVAVHWLNPFVWLARRQLILAQERAADDAVLAGGFPAPDYASLLASIRGANQSRLFIEKRNLQFVQERLAAAREAMVKGKGKLAAYVEAKSAYLQAKRIRLLESGERDW